MPISRKALLDHEMGLIEHFFNSCDSDLEKGLGLGLLKTYYEGERLNEIDSPGVISHPLLIKNIYNLYDMMEFAKPYCSDVGKSANRDTLIDCYLVYLHQTPEGDKTLRLIDSIGETPEYIALIKELYSKVYSEKDRDKGKWDDIADLQESYTKLIKSGGLTKQTICKLVIPFRDKYKLSDNQALQIARNELTISQIRDII